MTLHSLKIEIERLMKGPLEVDFELTPAEFDLLDDPEFTFDQPVTGNFTAQLVGDDNILVSGRMETEATAACVRCLEPMRVPLDVSFQFAFLPQRDERPRDDDPDDDEKLYYDKGIAHPRERLREELMLALPYLPKCELNAEGVCPVSGKEMEQGPMTFGPRSGDGDREAAQPNAPTAAWREQLASVRKQLEKQDGD